MTSLQVAQGNDRTIDKLVEALWSGRSDQGRLQPAPTSWFSPRRCLGEGRHIAVLRQRDQSARLLCRNIVTNPNETVRLVATDDSGKIVQIARIRLGGQN